MATESTGGLPGDFRRVLVLSTVAAAAIAAWATAPAWGPGLPGGDDVVPHLVRADFAFEHIFGRARLDGWFPRFMVGHQEFLFYGPGFTWLLAVIRVASFGAISTAGAMKLAGILTFAALAPAVALFVRATGASAAVAGAAGILSLAVNNPFGIGLHAIYVIGLVPHQLAAVLFFVVLTAVIECIRGDRRRWVLVAAIASALLVVTHAITAVIAVVFVVLVVPLQLLRRERHEGWVGRVALAGAVSAGLSAFWLLPLVGHLDLAGPVTTWATAPIAERVADIGTGQILFPRMLAELVLVGVAAAAGVAVVRRRWDLLTFSLVPLAYMGIAHALAGRWPSHPVSLQLANRGLGYVGVFSLVPVAAGLGWAGSRAAREFGRRGALAAMVVPIAGAVAIAGAAATDARLVVKKARAPARELAHAAGELRRAVPDGMRFATERDFPAEIATTGIAHPDLWLARQSGRDTLNLFNVESSPSRAGFTAEDIGAAPAPALAGRLARYGVSHVVTVRPATADALAHAGAFEEVWRDGDLAIFRLRPIANSSAVLSASAPIEAALVEAEPEHLALRVDSSSPARGSVALSWSPKWRVEIDGRTVPTAETHDGLVGFALPEGRSRVVLGYRRDAWDVVGLIVSAATVAAIALALYRLSSVSSLMSRRRSRTA